MHLSAGVSPSLSSLQDRGVGSRRREGLKLKSALGDIQTETLLGCVRLMRRCPHRPVQSDDLAWAHPAQREVRLLRAGAGLPTERGGFWVHLPGVMSINQ